MHRELCASARAMACRSALRSGRLGFRERRARLAGEGFGGMPAASIDVAAMRARKEKVIATLTGGLKQLAKKRSVQVVKDGAVSAAWAKSQSMASPPSPQLAGE